MKLSIKYSYSKAINMNVDNFKNQFQSIKVDREKIFNELMDRISKMDETNFRKGDKK